ncbi:MAG: hypothetical protein NTW12_06545 [Deltaproteobacteria bacterium]|nr:hypothetical protein [Deltaproteobacteria bacterium]
MKKRYIAALFFIFLHSHLCYAGDSALLSSPLESVKKDYRNFYLDGNNLIQLGIGIAGAGVFANTSMDKDIQEKYTKNVKSATTDDFSHIFRQPGEVYLTIPALLGTYAVFKDTATGEWAQRSLRAIAVGAPGGLFMQWATGGSPPSEGHSDWRPFNDNEGLSGHAFIGAVPFITAARMNDNLYIKGALYAVSVLPALSRINDDKHYFSQAAIGWYLAFLSCSAVAKTEDQNEYSFFILPLSHKGLAVMVSRSF